MHHHGIVGRRHVRLMPDRLIDRAHRHDAPAVLRQALEDGKFRLRQLQRRAVEQHAAVFLVQHDAGAEHPPARFVFIHPVAPQQRLHLHHKLRVGKGLGQIIVAAGVVGAALVVLLRLGREEQHRRRRAGAQPAARVVAVEVGHHDIHQNEVDLRAAPDGLDGLEAGRRLQNGISAVFKQDPADAPDIRLVVHHENADRFFHT